MLSAALAEYLDTEGVATYDATGVSGNVFLDALPDSPEVAVAIRQVPGQRKELGQPEEYPAIQVLVRGTRDPSTAEELATAIYDALHGLMNTDLGGSAYWVVMCQAMQHPGWIGADDNSRHIYSINFNLITDRS